jgi:hypothetical protein
VSPRPFAGHGQPVHKGIAFDARLRFLRQQQLQLTKPGLSAAETTRLERQKGLLGSRNRTDAGFTLSSCRTSSPASGIDPAELYRVFLTCSGQVGAWVGGTSGLEVVDDKRRSENSRSTSWGLDPAIGRGDSLISDHSEYADARGTRRDGSGLFRWG